VSAASSRPSASPKPAAPAEAPAHRLRLEMFDASTVDRIVGEALEVLADPGVRVQEAEAANLLESVGVAVRDGVARIPERVVRAALATVPGTFALHDRAGRPVVRYGAGEVAFDPGSSGVSVMDPQTGEHRPSRAADLVRLVRVAEVLEACSAQSTAVIVTDVPPEIGDLYRLLLVLLNSDKPIVTGSFSSVGTRPMIDLLALDAGGADVLRTGPRAVFDVCPSPPLRWSEFACRCLIDLGRAGVPAQMVSMPLAGGAAPVSLAGSVVQHAAESLSGIVIHQVAAPGAPIVWGGAPAILDMRTGSTPMGAIETAMLNAGNAQVGRSLGLPTHGYLGASDAKVVDAQAGLESATTALVAALAGIDMVSGIGMLDELRCQSAEKLVIDAEAVATALRLVRGIAVPEAGLGLAAIREAGFAGRFLELPETRRRFRSEQHIPSPVVERGSLGAWRAAGSRDAFARAREQVESILAAPRAPVLDGAAARALVEAVARDPRAVGLGRLPGIEGG
jgi:trimethylamine--corrinoid protein Co-methyltransferase